MATTVADFRESIRAYLLDTHATIKQFSAEQLDAAVRLVINLGLVPGVTVDDDDVITPALSPTDEDTEVAKNWARVVLYAAKRFVVGNAAASSYRTRALSESFGEAKEMVFELLTEIYSMEFAAGGE